MQTSVSKLMFSAILASSTALFPAMHAALAFILISGILGLVRSLVVGKGGRILLVVAGVFAARAYYFTLPSMHIDG